MPIKISLSSTEPLSIAADLLVLGVPEGSAMKDGTLGELAKRLGPTMARILKREEFTGKKDQSVELPGDGEIKAHKVLLIGLGKEPPTEVEVRVLAAKAGRAALASKASSLTIEVPRVTSEPAGPGALGVCPGERAAAE